MYEKLVDFFKIAKIVFKGLFKLFADLGLDTGKDSIPYTASKDLDDIADEVIDSGIPAKYID